MKLKVITALLLFSTLLLSNGQGVDDPLPSRIGVGNHGSSLNTISSLLGLGMKNTFSPDIFRYKNVTSIQYYNGSSWITVVTENWKRAFDGDFASFWDLTHEEVRFTIDLGGAWIYPSAILLSQDWGPSDNPYSLTMETSSNNSTWTSRLPETSTGGHTALNTFSISGTTGVDRYVRLTIKSNASSSSPLRINTLSGFSKRSVGVLQPFTISHDQKIGIGSVNPIAKLHVAGDAAVIGDLIIDYGKEIKVDTDWGGNGESTILKTGYELQRDDYIDFYVPGDASQNQTPRLTILQNGRVGIGNSYPTHKLEVNGTIRSKEVKVEASPWPDYVFDEDYRLPTIDYVANYIKSNKHLPEVPTALEVEENGIAVGEMNAILLKKIEELTLYTIQQNNEIEALRTQVRDLVERIEKVEEK